MASSPSDPVGQVDEDLLRGCVYRLLARFLAAPPDAAALAVAAGLDGDASPLGEALCRLAHEAKAATPAAAKDEYEALFVGLGRGELVPYGSFYRTGFLNEKPLALLRAELARLGIERTPGNRDPEDHIACLCEVMAGLIAGELGDAAADLTTQQGFFDRHLAPWVLRFFADLERARAARLYVPVGSLGRRFMEIEAAAFAMAA